VRSLLQGTGDPEKAGKTGTGAGEDGGKNLQRARSNIRNADVNCWAE